MLYIKGGIQVTSFGTMARNLILLLLLITFASAAVLKNGVTIPTYAEVCRRSDSNFDDCLKRSLQTLVPKISKNGIRKLQLGSLDPILIPEMLTSYSGAGYTFKSILRNAKTQGLSQIKFLSVRSDFKDLENINLEIDFYIPKIFSEGNYKLEGVVADFPVNGKGPYNISMTDVQGTLKINAHVIKEDNEEYLRVHRVGLRPDVGNMNLYFGNLIDGNPELSKTAVTFFNQFWKIIYPELLPYAEEGFDKVLRGMINQATLKIPFNQLIPE